LRRWGSGRRRDKRTCGACYGGHMGLLAPASAACRRRRGISRRDGRCRQRGTAQRAGHRRSIALTGVITDPRAFLGG
jgi:hypothetical protein